MVPGRPDPPHLLIGWSSSPDPLPGFRHHTSCLCAFPAGGCSGTFQEGAKGSPPSFPRVVLLHLHPGTLKEGDIPALAGVGGLPALPPACLAPNPLVPGRACLLLRISPSPDPAAKRKPSHHQLSTAHRHTKVGL